MIMAGVVAGQLPGDFTTEVPDPTIASTHPEVSSAVRSMIVHWGAPCYCPSFHNPTRCYP